MSDSSKKSIPSWQQNQQPKDNPSVPEQPHTSDSSTQSSHAELLKQAEDFLKDEAIRNASRERKVAFLQKKGLQASDIETLLDGETIETSKEESDELRTVHDSNKDENTASTPPKPSTQDVSEEPTEAPSRPVASQQPQRDMPPIITYPEFLLKPQKPPPLVTVPRLINGAYIFAGLATLTYGASKYIVEPMVTTLTEARHSLASTTLTDLEQLNNKLETTVSHVPYIASAAALRKSQEQHRDADDDVESTTSDPTELFHRDIATQTTPSLSRTASRNGDDDDSKTHLDATTHQVMRLSSLHETLTSLVHVLDPKDVPYLPPPASKKLRESVSDFQAVLDKLETTYNPLKGDYYNSIYATADNKTRGSGKDGDVAARVRTEIRNLKGVFLSARNFPTAPRPTAYATR